MENMAEPKKMVMQQHQIPGQHWGAGKPLSKSFKEVRMAEKDWEDKDRNIKGRTIFLKRGGEVKITEKIEELYTYLKWLITEEEQYITFPDWNGVDEYQNPIDPTSL